jgi:hypothetical protein
MSEYPDYTTSELVGALRKIGKLVEVADWGGWDDMSGILEEISDEIDELKEAGFI